MFNFITKDDFQQSLMSATFVGCAVLLYNLNHKRNKYKQSIKQLSSSKIYQFDEFIKQQQKRIQSTLFQAHEQCNTSERIRSEQTFLIKTTSSNKPFEVHFQNVYSNQVYFSPPSQNLMLKKSLRKYHKQIKYEWNNLMDLSYNKQLLFQGKILTDKITCQTKYYPRQKYQSSSNLNKTILQKIKDILYGLGQEIYEISQTVCYYLQKCIQILYFNRKKARSNIQRRTPLFKGVYAGLLYAHFRFLPFTNFLLKVQVQGNQFRTQLVADNKIMIIDYYKILLRKLNIGMLGIGLIMLSIGVYQVYRYRLLIKIYWKNLTYKNQRHLNPQGIQDDKLCQICYVHCRNVLFYKCRHLIICQECYFHLQQKKCIICNQMLEKKQILYAKSQ